MDRIQLRRDTSANWKSSNPVLLEGELAFETDTRLRKIGDGVNNYNSLEYLAAENVVQELGNSTTAVISLKTVSTKLTGLTKEVTTLELDTLRMYNSSNARFHGYPYRVAAPKDLNVVQVDGQFYTKTGEIVLNSAFCSADIPFTELSWALIELRFAAAPYFDESGAVSYFYDSSGALIEQIYSGGGDPVYFRVPKGTVGVKVSSRKTSDGTIIGTPVITARLCNRFPTQVSSDNFDEFVDNQALLVPKPFTEVYEWSEGYYWTSDLVLTKYNGSSKWAACKIDVSHFNGVALFSMNCPLGVLYVAKTVLVDEGGNKTYVNTTLGTYSVTAAIRNQKWLYISTEYSTLPLDKTFVCPVSDTSVAYLYENLFVNNKASNPLKGLKFSILGDSISTYTGYIPSASITRYPSGDVNSVDKTYWGRLISNDEMVLVTNNSYGGTMIAKFPGQSAASDTAMCDDTRLATLGDSDIIFVFGGTNDFGYANRCRPIGDLKLDGTEFDVTSFKQAILYTIQYLLKNYPHSLICFLTPLQRGRYHEYGASIIDYPSKNELNLFEFQYRDAIKEVAGIYGCEVIDTNNCGITYFNGTNNANASGGTNLYMQDGVHPNAAGMDIIYKYIRLWLLSRFS